MRLALIIPDVGATVPLHARLQSIPDWQGKQGRARLLAQVIQAGVNVLYRGVIAVATQPAPAARQKASHPATSDAPALPD